jgi:hypothetical protein
MMNEGVEPLLNKLQAIDGDYDLILEGLGRGTVKQEAANDVADELKEAMTHVIEKLNELKALLDTNRAIIEGGSEEDKEHLKKVISDIPDIENSILEDIIVRHKVVLKGFKKDSVPVATFPTPSEFGNVPSSPITTVSPRKQSGGRRTKKKGKGRLTKKANGKGRKTRKAKSRK